MRSLKIESVVQTVSLKHQDSGFLYPELCTAQDDLFIPS